MASISLVPRIDSENLQVSGARLRGGASAEAFGAAEARGLAQIGQGLQSVANAAEKIEERFDAADAADLDNQYSAFLRQRLYDPQSGYFTQRGKAALDTRQGVEADLDTQINLLAARARSTRAGEVFRERAGQRRNDAATRIDVFAGEQLRVHEDNTIAAQFNEARENAISSFGDEQLSGRYLIEASQYARQLGAHRGLQGDALEQFVRENTSNAAGGTLEALGAQDPALAWTRLALLRDRMNTQDVQGVERMIQHGLLSQAQADPIGVEAAIRRAEDGESNPYSVFTEAQRNQVAAWAQNERERRAAVARAQFSTRMSEQMLKMELGMEVPDLVTPEQVENVLGRPAALEWRQRTTVQRYANDPSITRSSSDHLMRLASRPLPETDSPEQRINNIAHRQAAALELQRRREDPRAWTERRYGIQSQNFGALMDQARRSGNYDAVGRELMERVSYAGQAQQQGVAPVLLTRAEAEQTRAMLANSDLMNSAQRAQFWQVMRGVLGPGDSYRLRQQLASDSPAMAAAAEHASRADGAQRAERFDRGARLLRTGRADEGENQTSGRAQAFRLQSSSGDNVEQKLREAWRIHVGSGDANIYAGNYEAMERDFEAFRAYYAALADENGLMGFDVTRASEAANATTGNIGAWNGRRTMLPGRMTQESAERSMRAAWPDMERRYGVGRFENYEFAALGVVNDPNSRHEGWTRYAVMEGGRIVRDRNGAPVYIYLINEQR